MSGKSIKEILKEFGLADNQAKIYIFLAKHGVLKGGEISKQAKMPKAVVYRTLKILQRKGFVESTLESPARFTAVPFEVIIDYNIKTRKEEALQIENSKKDLLNDWQTMNKQKSAPSMPKFTVIEGNKKIFGKISEMIKNTKQKISIISSSQGLLRAERLGILDEFSKHPLKQKIKIRFITEITKQNLETIKKLYKKLKKESKIKARAPEIKTPPSPRMVLRDNKEIMFFITSEPLPKDEACFCTNCSSIIQAYRNVFEELWENSLDIEKKIIELETGKPVSKMKLLKNIKTTEKLYFDSLDNAKKEILIVTSSNRIKGLVNNIKSLNKWCKNGVSIKIMAPITTENLESTNKLFDCCEVKHIPIGYSEMTIIDNQKLFQFTKPYPENNKNSELLNLEDVLFTNSPVYINRMKNMLFDMWRTTRRPSYDDAAFISSLRTTSDSPVFDREYMEKNIDFFQKKKVDYTKLVTEEEVLKKIENEKKQFLKKNPRWQDTIKYFSIRATAVINPPKKFNLPKMVINVFKHDKVSSFGTENYLIIDLWQNKKEGPSYTPVCVVLNSDKALDIRQSVFAGFPAEKNILVFKKDEIQIRVKGNTLFAVWTKPIQLFPTKYILPPSCLLFEGYGKINSGMCTNVVRSGRRQEIWYNYYTAFVTFFHPKSKYVGSGTEGFFEREGMLISKPPKLELEK